MGGGLGIACPVCFEAATRPFAQKYGHAMDECRRCGVVFSPTGARVDTRSLYDGLYGRGGIDIAPTVRDSLAQVVRSSERFRLSGRWLDVGYGHGALLASAGNAGWSCYGVESSGPALDEGAKRGWTVSPAPATDVRFAPGAFDVVSMVEFLEHVPDPVAHLRAAAGWLRSGGLLYLTTPNVESLNRRWLGPAWSIFSPPEHIVVWSARALRAALPRAGFRVTRLRAEGFNPYEILSTLSPRHRERAGDRNQSAVTLSAALSTSRWRRAMKKIVNAPLSALRLGDTLKIWAVRE